MISPEILDRILPGVSKPGRYVGHEWNSANKDWDSAAVHFALAYPDIYEIGMSNLGLAILYDVINSRSDALADRVYAPWPDMAAAMRVSGLPLYGLESRRPLADFDLIGFSLQYELTYTNVLEMLDLAGLPVRAAGRAPDAPLIIAGGSGTYNPEPVADFFDLLVIGEGEEIIGELVDAYCQVNPPGHPRNKEAFLRRAAQIEGVYVPSLYDVVPHSGVMTVSPRKPEARPIIAKRLVQRLPPPPTRPVVPYIEVVHDRAMIEIQRGCAHGCRFCQAGVCYRPVRERPMAEVIESIASLLANTGYNEVALVSLSSTDYTHIEPLVAELVRRYHNQRISVSLPSLRIDSFSVRLAQMLHETRKTGLTFAPEAGSQRLRDAINKRVTREDLLRTAESAYNSGWQRIKLYFMIGLPTETMDDVSAIAELVREVHAVGRRAHGKRAQVSVSVTTFVPKPHTPYQWLPLEDEIVLQSKQELLQGRLRDRGIYLSWSDPQTTLLEAALSRGDRRLGAVIERAWRNGAIFDAWGEHFRPDIWATAFTAEGLSADDFARRRYGRGDKLPWDHISTGVSRDYLWEEYQRTLRGEPGSNCLEKCASCGVREAFDLEECPVVARGVP